MCETTTTLTEKAGAALSAMFRERPGKASRRGPLSRSRGQMSLWAVHMEPLLKANTRSLDTSRNHPLSNNKETSPQNGPGSTSPSLFRARLNTCELTNAHTDVQVHNEKVPYNPPRCTHFGTPATATHTHTNTPPHPR